MTLVWKAVRPFNGYQPSGPMHFQSATQGLTLCGASYYGTDARLDDYSTGERWLFWDAQIREDHVKRLDQEGDLCSRCLDAVKARERGPTQ